MKLYILFYFIIFAISLRAQETYLSQYYPFSSTDRFTRFQDVLYENDSLTVFGQINDDTIRWNQNAFIARFDTLGNLARIKILYHPDDKESVIPYEFAKISTTSDGGYLIFISAFDVWSHEVLYKLDKNFNIEFSKIYNIGNSTTLSIESIEILNHYYSASIVSTPENDAFVGLLKTDNLGNLVWNNIYSDSTAILHQIKKYKSNEITLTLSKKRIIGSGLSILTIDTSGNIIKEVKSEKINEGACYSLDTIGDGGYIYVSHDFPNPPDIYTTETRITRIDSVGKVVWERRFAEGEKNNSLLYDMEKNNDGSFTIIGELYGKGLAIRINQDGEIQWRHKYVNNSIQGSTGYFQVLKASAMLLGGNIIGCGSFFNHTPGPGAEQGWLVKILPDGCIDALCKTNISTETLSTFISPEENGNIANIYPNPTSGQVFVDLNVYVKESIFQAFDLTGHLILKKNINPGKNVLQFDNSYTGLVLYTIHDEKGKMIKSGKLIIIK